MGRLKRNIKVDDLVSQYKERLYEKRLQQQELKQQEKSKNMKATGQHSFERESVRSFSQMERQSSCK